MPCPNCDRSDYSPDQRLDAKAPTDLCEVCGELEEDGCANDARTGFLARLGQFGLGENTSPLFLRDS